MRHLDGAKQASAGDYEFDEKQTLYMRLRKKSFRLSLCIVPDLHYLCRLN